MEQLLALGFSADQSRAALQECDGDMQQAVHLILSRETPGTPLILFPGPGHIDISEGELTIFHLTPISLDLKPKS